MAAGRKTKAAARKQAPRKPLGRDQAKIARLEKDLSDSLAQQAATTEILALIRKTPSDTQQVFEAIAARAAQLCEAADAVVLMREGDSLRWAAHHGTIPGRYIGRAQPVDRGMVAGRSVLEARQVHVPDLRLARKEFPESSRLAREFGHRAILATPMLRGRKAIGVITIRRMEAGRFGPRQLALLRTFADQAVIAIENVRLFNETRESLERQTATAEILKVIASSPSDIQPIMNAVAERAAHLCAATDAHVWRRDGEELEVVAGFGGLPVRRPRLTISRQSVMGRAVADGEPVHVLDLRAVFKTEFPDSRAMMEGGYRTVLGMPLLREGMPIGGILIRRREVQPFSDKQIALLQTFADQAVIAIENVRLFNETREALERQTATAEILKVISGSPTNVQPVFDAIVNSCVRLFGGMDVSLNLTRGDFIERPAIAMSDKARDTAADIFPIPLSEESISGRAIVRGELVQVHDVRKEAWLGQRARVATRRMGYRRALCVPMMRENTAIGAIIVFGGAPGWFSDKQIALLQTFADQAVIAIENVRLFNETREALERQTATAEILKVISSSPTDTQPVFDVIAKSGVRLFDGLNVVILLRKDPHFVLAGYSGQGMEDLPAEVRTAPLDREKNFPSRAILDGKVLHITDWEGGDVPEHEKVVAKSFGIKSGLMVPLLRQGEGIGAIAVVRTKTGPFPAKDIALLQSFADQAVIAIENVRLFNETKEALERQTATAEILKVIASSPSDVQPVLDAIAERAAILCGAPNANVLLQDGDVLRTMAGFYRDVGGEAPDRTSTVPLRRTFVNGRAFLERTIMHCEDIVPLLDTEYPDSRDLILRFGIRTHLVIPLIREDQALGTISLWRREVLPFSSAEVALVQTFADQAVIAIENVRLFNETREALERQTATSELLKVIGQSTSDLQPVFDTLAENAVKVCEAGQAFIFRFDGKFLRVVASCNVSDELRRYFANHPIVPGRATVAGRAAAEGRTIHVHDVRADPEYSWAAHQVDPIRTVLTIPMIRAGEVLGVIGVNRPEVRPFSEHQVELLRTFADQAVIAIANVRLFNETREALERQTATAEILKVISSSPTDTQPVFDAIARSAYRLIGGFSTAVARVFDDVLHLVAFSSTGEAGNEALKNAFPIPVSHSKAARTAAPVCISDTDALPESAAALREVARVRGFRSIVIVPMLREGVATGTISVTRREPGEFSNHQVDLLKTFADQAVIAIENVRLFNETREALERQTASAEVLASISGSMTDAKPVFDTIARNVQRLMGTRFAVVQVLRDGMVEMPAAAGHGEGFERLTERYPRPLDDTTTGGRAMLSMQVQQLTPVIGNPLTPAPVEQFARDFGFDSVLFAPMMREGRVIGAIGAAHREATAFDDKQIALIKTFADQAVIAIENVRLFNETKEALERQTASAEVLSAISGSIADTKPVFDKITESCERLFAGDLVGVTVVDATDQIVLAAYHGPNEEALRRVYPLPLSQDSGTGSAILDAVVKHYPDVDAQGVPAGVVAGCSVLHNKAIVFAPLIAGGRGIGAIWVGRLRAGAFSERDIDLLRTFADQAVIAIQNARLFNETREALEQQTATASVLRVISASPNDLGPVFVSILEHATRLCEAQSGFLYSCDGRAFDLVAHRGLEGEPLARFKRITHEQRVRGPKTALGRMLEAKRPIHIPDVMDDEGYRSRDPARLAVVELVGARSFLAVPLLKEGTVSGAIIIYRREVRPFLDKQVALLQTFADQAVIAIENVRMFNETKEALERQTATAEVLRVISSSPSDLEPVYRTILEHILRLCESHIGALFLSDGQMLSTAATLGTTPEMDKQLRQGRIPLSRATTTRLAALERRVVHVPDLLADPAFSPTPRELYERENVRTVLSVPMLKEGALTGVITAWRREVRPFDDKQVALIKTFADQAVIAIENVRLFNETKEALERQTATADILRVISGSPTDTQPVFDVILERATILCEAETGILFRYENGAYRAIATRIPDPAFREVFNQPLQPTPKSAIGRMLATKAPVHIPDVLDDDAYREGDPLRRQIVEIGKVRTWLGVPLLKDGELIGAIVIYRKEQRPFGEHQIALLQTFADQAVIAIENVRLFNETREALERQTATAEILKVISSSTTDVQPVFDAIVQSAARLFGCNTGIVMREDMNIQLRAAAGRQVSQGTLEEMLKLYPIPFDTSKSIAARVIAECKIAEILDTEAADIPPMVAAVGRAGRFRSATIAPLQREGVGIGGITLTRPEPGFKLDEKQLSLLKTFADQAVIAIENVRLFKELQTRTEALTRSVGQLQALGEVGQAISSTLDLETVLRTIVSRALQLTGLDGGSIYEYEEASKEFHLQASENIDEEIVAVVRATPGRLGEGAIGRAGETREPAAIPDIQNQSYTARLREPLIRAGYRALLAVPLLREEHLLGALVVNRKTPGPFAPEVVELLKTFATQSAMAIQNARLFREIADKGKQLEVASRHKSDFLASMSHELRTPLNAILGFNEMILAGVYGEAPQDMKEPLADIQSSGKHLLRLINNVLDLAKIEAGRMELSLSDYSVQDTVESVRSTLRPLAAEKGLEFLATVPEDLPLAYGDSGRITQCLMNLAGNSLKFTKAGKVEISVTQRDGLLTYRVSDTGMGIAPDKIGNLFTEFKQTDATIASEYGGTGLGLSISKKFIEMHGGRIWVESELGKGSSFIFELPLRVKGEAAQ